MIALVGLWFRFLTFYSLFFPSFGLFLSMIWGIRQLLRVRVRVPYVMTFSCVFVY